MALTSTRPKSALYERHEIPYGNREHFASCGNLDRIAMNVAMVFHNRAFFDKPIEGFEESILESKKHRPCTCWGRGHYPNIEPPWTLFTVRQIRHAPIHVVNVIAAAIKGNDFELYLAACSSFDDGIVGFGNPLYFASAFGNLDAVSFLLDNKAQVNKKGGRFGHPLQAAAVRGHIKVVEILMKHGADPNLTGGFYGTPLQAAACEGHLEIATYLLDNKAQTDALSNGRFGSPLRAAIWMKNLKMVQKLVSSGAKIRSSAIIMAAARGDSEIVKFLVNKGADVNAIGHRTFSVLWYACCRGDLLLVQFLIENGATIDLPGCNLLVAAIRSESQELFEFLLQKNCKGWLSDASLEAGFRGNSSLVKLLLKQGADIDALGCANFTILSHACLQGDLQLVLYLIREGATIYFDSCVKGRGEQASQNLLALAVRSRNQELVMYFFQNRPCERWLPGAIVQAACQGDLHIVVLLVHRGANVNAHDHYSVLQHACESGNLEVVKFLIEEGAYRHEDRNLLNPAVTSGQETVLTFLLNNKPFESWIPEAILIAAKHNNLTSIKLLLQQLRNVKHEKHRKAVYQVHEALISAFAHANLEMANLLLEQMADIQDCGSCGQQHEELMTAAIESGQQDFVKKLLSHSLDSVQFGFNLAYSNGDKDTANLLEQKGAILDLRLAVECHNETWVRNLLDKTNINMQSSNQDSKSSNQDSQSSNQDSQSSNQDSVLRLAVCCSSTSIVQLLLQHHVDINLSAPLQAAASQGDDYMVKLLLEAGADVNSKYGTNYFNENSLISAVKAGSLSTVNLLLQYGAKHSQSDLQQYLKSAIKEGNILQAQHLVEHGAQVTRASIQLAVEHGKVDIIQQFLKSCKLEQLPKTSQGDLFVFRYMKVVYIFFGSSLELRYAIDFDSDKTLVDYDVDALAAAHEAESLITLPLSDIDPSEGNFIADYEPPLPANPCFFD